MAVEARVVEVAGEVACAAGLRAEVSPAEGSPLLGRPLEVAEEEA